MAAPEEGAWVSEYAILKQMTATRSLGHSTRSGSSGSLSCVSSPSWHSFDSLSSRTLRDYGSLGSWELWQWLWLDFSAPAKSPVAKLIRRNMRSHSKEPFDETLLESESVSFPRMESVGFSRMVSQALAPLGEGSLLAAVFTLVSSAMGAGCLSLPFMIKRAGLLLGPLMLAVGALLAHLSLVVLMSCARYTDSESMSRLVSLAQGGSGSSRVVDVVIAIYGIAAVLCYLIFIGDFFSGIAKAPLLNLEVSRENVIIMLSVCVVWPLSLPRSLSALRHVCILSVSAICLTAVAVACKAPTHISSQAGEMQTPETWALKWWTTDPHDLLQSFSIALFAFAAHTNAVPVATSLKKADAGSIWRVSLYSVCIELLFYSLMGLGGYLSFRGLTEQNFILNYRNDDVVMFLVRCVYGVVVCLGAPINLSPAASSILAVISPKCRSPHALHCLVVTTIIVACVGVALANEQIADVIGLIGASFGSLIVLAWPALIYRKALFDLHPPRLACFVFCSLAFATFLGFLAFLVQARSVWC